MRCVAVNAGGAETEPSEPLSELGSAEAGGRKGGVSLFEEGGKAPGDSCIMFRCIVSREAGGEDAQKAVSARGGTGTQQEPPSLQVEDPPQQLSITKLRHTS